MTLDGFLPETDNVLTQWAMNHKKGFVQWRERCNARILPHSILDLLCEKDRKSDSFIVHPNRLLHGKLSMTTPRKLFSIRPEYARIFPMERTP